MRELLRRGRNWVWNQKYRIQLGMQWIQIINLCLLLVAVSDKFVGLTGVRTSEFVMIVTGMVFVGMWVFGMVLDKIIRGGESEEATQIKRTPILRHHYSQQQEILDTVHEIARLLREQKSP